MKKTIKIGIFGLGRGSAFFESILLNNGEIVAVCEKNQKKMDAAMKKLSPDVATYTNFDEFIEHDGLEAVFLCNYFHEHAEFAIRCLEKNIHVLSECASNGTMADGVALIRATEKSDAIYMLAENYPYMAFNVEMRRLYRGGTLGKLLYAEGEYNHPSDPMDNKRIKGLREHRTHWRNNLPRTYYITHSLAPLMYISGATPIRVTAMPCYEPYPEGSLFNCNVNDRSAIITCLNDDDSVFRVTGASGFGAHNNAYRICCVNGQAENRRGDNDRVTVRYDEWATPEGQSSYQNYAPSWNDPDEELIKKATHGGGDFLVIREFFDAIRENRQPIFDVYFATTMASVGILAHPRLRDHFRDLQIQPRGICFHNLQRRHFRKYGISYLRCGCPQHQEAYRCVY